MITKVRMLDPAHLDAHFETTDRKEKNMIRRIRDRQKDLSASNPVIAGPALKKPINKTNLAKGRR